ncbi:Receptor homology region [Diplonema papillatum]|nr:Receptor homology region [Diplonema papillatum]
MSSTASGQRVKAFIKKACSDLKKQAAQIRSKASSKGSEMVKSESAVSLCESSTSSISSIAPESGRCTPTVSDSTLCEPAAPVNPLSLPEPSQAVQTQKKATKRKAGARRAASRRQAKKKLTVWGKIAAGTKSFFSFFSIEPQQYHLSRGDFTNEEKRHVAKMMQEYARKSSRSANGKSVIDMSDPNVPLEIRLTLMTDFSSIDYELLLRLDEDVKKPAKQRDLSSLPMPTTFEGDVSSEDEGTIGHEPETCAICLVDFEKGCKTQSLRCGHAFHETCVMQWLTSYNDFCPSCRCPCEAPDADEPASSTCSHPATPAPIEA